MSKDQLMNLLGESPLEALARLTAERDALARHIEQLIAPVAYEEVDTLTMNIQKAQHQGVPTHANAVHFALELFIFGRQRKGQFAALS